MSDCAIQGGCVYIDFVVLNKFGYRSFRGELVKLGVIIKRID